MASPSLPPQRALIEIVGSLNMDLVTVTDRVPGPGETLHAQSFSTGFGGKGANQAVASARLLRRGPDQSLADGVRVSMHGAVGDDQHGRDFLAHLERERIDVSGVVVKQGFTTGTAVILVEAATGENRILVTRGANGQLTPDDVRLASPTAGVAHYVLFQMEIPLPTLVECMRAAALAGKKILLNAAPVASLPDEVYPWLAYLMVNEGEAAALSGEPAEGIDSRLDDISKIFRQKGMKGSIVVTLGSKGAYICDLSKEQIQGEIVPCPKVDKVIDTTAAGDTFCGAFAVALSQAAVNLASVEAAHFANSAAAVTVQKRGAQSSIPFRGEVTDNTKH